MYVSFPEDRNPPCDLLAPVYCHCSRSLAFLRSKQQSTRQRMRKKTQEEAEEVSLAAYSIHSSTLIFAGTTSPKTVRVVRLGNFFPILQGPFPTAYLWIRQNSNVGDNGGSGGLVRVFSASFMSHGFYPDQITGSIYPLVPHRCWNTDTQSAISLPSLPGRYSSDGWKSLSTSLCRHLHRYRTFGSGFHTSVFAKRIGNVEILGANG